MKYLQTARIALSIICLAALAGNYVLQPTAAIARTTLPATGQLSFAYLVAVNENVGTAGQTVFSGNRLKVAKQGTAIVNLGKLGRIELGAESDFILRIDDDTIGGELNSGCATISAPAGVAVALNTSKGAVTTDARRPAALSVGYKGGSANVVPNLGEVKVTMGDKAESAKPGEFITMASDPKGAGNLLRRPAGDCSAPGALCACATGTAPRASAAAKSAAAKSSNGTFLPLLFGAAMVTISTIFLATGGGQGLTCVDSNGLFCRRVSPTSPIP